ncbi:MAG: hypothetical protein IIA02_09475 [Proteobacteria bacterium]|uniref:polyhydroxyalkanoate granule-associated phasin n=1 Tax=Aquabacterium sp. TaxID=1872578 RepID=UPI0035C74C61|nr:hypothetical protein [Pseudomonadota bacterium]
MPARPHDAPDAPQRLATQAIELSVAAPQVVAQRLTRMALAGLNPSTEHHDELVRMGSEKVQAFQESWLAMWAQAWQSQLALAESVARSSLDMLVGRDHPASVLMQVPTEAAEVLSAGLAPLRDKAMDNARRLSVPAGAATASAEAVA